MRTWPGNSMRSPRSARAGRGRGRRPAGGAPGAGAGDAAGAAARGASPAGGTDRPGGGAAGRPVGRARGTGPAGQPSSQAARGAAGGGGAVGRRFDFLVQEFNREANTLCSKSASVALTAIGLQLKARSSSCASRCRTSNERRRDRLAAARPVPGDRARPSGAGKSAIAARAAGQRTDAALSVSVTTRPPRPGEQDGVHYHFRDQAEFDAHGAKRARCWNGPRVFGR